jgi:ABC-type transporter Mla subunit MlaD
VSKKRPLVFSFFFPSVLASFTVSSSSVDANIFPVRSNETSNSNSQTVAQTEQTTQQMQQVIQQTQQVIKQVQQVVQNSQQATQQAAQQAQQTTRQAQSAANTAETAATAAQEAASQATQAAEQIQSQPQAINITSVAAEADINVAYGTDLASLNLQTTVNVTLSDSTNQTVSVAWDNGTPTYDPNTSGMYVFSGTLTFSGSITNTNNLIASVNVIVAPQPLPDATGEIIQDAASSLLNGVWNFVKSMFVSVAKAASLLTGALIEPILKLFGK